VGGDKSQKCGASQYGRCRWQDGARSGVNCNTLKGDVPVPIKCLTGAGHRNKRNHLNEQSERGGKKERKKKERGGKGNIVKHVVDK